MPYRLKNRELEEKLNALCDTNSFSSELQKQMLSQKDNEVIIIDFGNYLLVGKNIPQIREYRAKFYREAIETYEEFDPKKWNLYSRVTPPQNAPLQIEYEICGRTKKDCCVYRNRWWFTYNDLIPLSRDAEDIRFRPWGDEPC